MRIRGLGRLKSYGKWCVNTLRRPGMILLYHRVIDLQSDPQLLAVSPANFEQQMRFVRDRMTPMALDRFTELASHESLPKDAVAITFDDGYHDNLEFAAPIMEKYDIPATVYVTSGQVGNPCEFWWDELEAILLSGGRLPDRCSLILGGKKLHWILGASSEDADANRNWNIFCQEELSPRQKMYRDLCAQIRLLGANERNAALNQLRDWAGTDGTARATHQALTERELIELARSPCVEIGGHTHQHSLLSALSLDDQRREIETGKARLEGILGAPVRSFAYPFGGRADYSPETARLVFEAGFRNACANWFSWIKKSNDVFQLPRFLVRNWSGSELEKRMAQCRFT